jgi:hypothetical protein
MANLDIEHAKAQIAKLRDAEEYVSGVSKSQIFESAWKVPPPRANFALSQDYITKYREEFIKGAEKRQSLPSTVELVRGSVVYTRPVIGVDLAADDAITDNAVFVQCRSHVAGSGAPAFKLPKSVAEVEHDRIVAKNQNVLIDEWSRDNLDGPTMFHDWLKSPEGLKAIDEAEHPKVTRITTEGLYDEARRILDDKVLGSAKKRMDRWIDVSIELALAGESLDSSAGIDANCEMVLRDLDGDGVYIETPAAKIAPPTPEQKTFNALTMAPLDLDHKLGCVVQRKRRT